MSALGGFFDGDHVLELCAGTGAVALELLSRGCAAAVLVERDPTAQACIRRNVQRAAMADRVELLATHVFDAIDQLTKRRERFDLVFFDPPYDADLVQPVLTRLADGALFNPDARMVVEVRRSATPISLPAPWQLQASHHYGDSTMLRLLHDPEPRP